MVLTFLLIILGGLNYFNIVPVSQNISFLAFLPSSKQVINYSSNTLNNPIDSKKSAINNQTTLISKPIMIRNDSNNFTGQAIPNTFMQPTNPNELRISIAVSPKISRSSEK